MKHVKPHRAGSSLSVNLVGVNDLHRQGFHDLYEGTEPVQADGKYFPELMVQRSLEFLDQNRDRPFFLYVPFNIPHYPEQALKQFQGLYEDMQDPARRSYGEIVTTAGLLAGRDILAHLGSEHRRGDLILIPGEALNGDDLFIDSLPLSELEAAVAPARVVKGFQILDVLRELEPAGVS